LDWRHSAPEVLSDLSYPGICDARSYGRGMLLLLTGGEVQQGLLFCEHICVIAVGLPGAACCGCFGVILQESMGEHRGGFICSLYPCSADLCWCKVGEEGKGTGAFRCFIFACTSLRLGEGHWY